MWEFIKGERILIWAFSLFIGLILAAKCTQAQAKEVVITKDNTIILRGEVSSESMSKLTKDLLTNPNQELFLFQDSPGGSIIAGNNFIAAMQDSGKIVNCVQMFSASMSVVIMQSCAKRYVLSNSIVMLHQASLGMGNSPMANQKNMFSLIERIVDKIEKMQAKRIGLNIDKYRAKVAHDWWLFDGEAVEEGVADELVQARCDKDTVLAVEVEYFRTMFGTFKVSWSKCALITEPLDVELEGSKTKAESMVKFNEWRNQLRSVEHIKSINKL